MTPTTQQQQTIAAAGMKYNVDPRLIDAVWSKEYSYGQAPEGWFQTFGLISGPGAYNGTGYTPTGNTFQDAVYTVAAYVASARKDYDAQRPAEPFLQYFDNIYSPPASNPNSYPNLVSAFSGLGGDANSEATLTGLNSPFQGWGSISGGTDPSKNPINQTVKASTGVDIANALSSFQSAANDWVLYATAGGLFLALIGGGIAIMAAGNPAIVKTAERAAIAA